VIARHLTAYAIVLLILIIGCIGEAMREPRENFGKWCLGAAIAGLIALVALFGLWVSAASAHDQWADGSPVPEWVKQYCCGPADVHHYRFDEVKVTPEGYVLPDYPNVIPANDPTHVFKSEDGEYWAFFATYSTGEKSPIYCLFVPPGAS
jgi:hypothetical protein